jgi:hypothetical protein
MEGLDEDARGDDYFSFVMQGVSVATDRMYRYLACNAFTARIPCRKPDR